ncbi:sulfotransferase [Patescibacteria group bacterium]|nr:sulfotransferase [Patescibacteria group bacterium]
MFNRRKQEIPGILGTEKVPNFFIIGAPKCGTTAMSEYLSEHPQIFISNPKEPHYFNSDLKFNKRNNTVARYKECFEGVASQHDVIGEASTWYLFSDKAVGNILKLNPKAKFIVMVRSPIELAYALHSENYFHSDENVKDFEEAWNLQDIRKSGKRIPIFCEEPALLMYGDVAKVGEQVEKLFSLVPQDNTKIVFFDDLKNNTKGEYRKILDFLGVEFDDRYIFPPKNMNKIARFDFLKPLFRVGDSLKSLFRIRYSFGILNRMVGLNTVNKKRSILSETFIEHLIDYFSEDIKKLSKATNNDLSSWLNKDYYKY